MVCTPRIPAAFVGRPTPDLQAEFTALQQALAELSRGAKLVQGSYAQGDGVKAVTYQQADAGWMQFRLEQLAAILYPGQGYGRRRPIRMLYR